MAPIWIRIFVRSLTASFQVSLFFFNAQCAKNSCQPHIVPLECLDGHLRIVIHREDMLTIYETFVRLEWSISSTQRFLGLLKIFLDNFFSKLIKRGPICGFCLIKRRKVNYPDKKMAFIWDLRVKAVAKVGRWSEEFPKSMLRVILGAIKKHIFMTLSSLMILN